MSNIRLQLTIIFLVLSTPFLKSLLSVQYTKGISTPRFFSKTFTLKQSVDDDDDFELMRSSISNLLLTEESSDNLEVNAVITDDSQQPASSFNKPRTLTAAISILLGSAIFFFQSTQQVSGVALLKQMEKESLPLQVNNCVTILLLTVSHELSVDINNINLFNRPPSAVINQLWLNFTQIGAKAAKY